MSDFWNTTSPALIAPVNKVAQYQSEAKVAQQESDKANSFWGLVKNTVLGVPKALKETLLPNRGYSDEEIKKANPTTKEKLNAIPKLGSEIFWGLGSLGSGLLNKIPAVKRESEKLANTKLGGALGDFGGKVANYSVPKTAGEAKAMQLADFGSNFIPVGGTAKNVGKATKAIDALTKAEMVEVIDYARLKKPFNQTIEENAGKLAEKFGITDKNIGGVANKLEELVAKTKTTNFVKDDAGKFAGSEKKTPPTEAFGAIGGIQQDDDGNITFDPTKAVLGIGAMHGVNKFKGGFNAEKYVSEMAVKEPKVGFLNKAKTFLADAKKKLVDSNAPIEDILSKNLAKNKISLLPEHDITNYIDRVYRAPTLAGQFARDNGLEDVIKKVDNLDNLDQYMIAKQATDVNTRGITTGRDFDKDQQLIKAFAPKYEEQAKLVNQYSQKLLDYAMDSGLVKKDTAQMLKERYPNYVPLKRVMDDIEKGGTGRGVASISKQTAVQSIKGSERQIESPIKSILEKTNDVFAQGEKNKAAKTLASYEKLPDNPFGLKEIKAMVDEQTGKRIFMEGDNAKDTISFFDNGEKRIFKTTPEIAQAAKALDVQQLNILGKIFALPVRVAKVGITGINLPFVASNVAKDQISAFINSNNALRTSVANPKNFVKALFGAVGHDELYKEMVRAGGGGTSFDIARNQIPQSIDRIRAGKNLASKIKYTVTHPRELLRTVENVIGRSEELTRLQQFRGTRQALTKQGLDAKNATMGAARAARENTVNFARSGEWGKVLNSAFLYLNAGIQGSRTFLRTLKTNPVGATVKLATAVLLPTATITAWNLSDPDRKKAYEDIPEYEKEGNLIIIPNNPTKDKDGKWNVIKVPLSQEINNLANIPRRAVEGAYKLDPLRAGEVAKNLIGSVSPINPTKGSVVSTLVPQAIKPTLEGVTNKNFFTGYPQVPQSMENLPNKLQVKPNTSGTATKIANALGLSPIKTEAFLKETFGSITPQILHTSDKILTPNQVGGQSTGSAIASRFTKAAGGAVENKQYEAMQAVTDAHSAKNKVENLKVQPTYDKVQQLAKEGKQDEAKAIVDGLSDADYEVYKRIKTTDKRNQTAEAERAMLPTTQKILELVGQGKQDEAQKIIENMTDEEYRIYKLTKNKLQ